MVRMVSARALKRMSRYWGPFFGARIRIKRISDDYREIDVAMKLGRFNRNYVGTHFGGSLYAMTDPFYMLMLLKNLSNDYMVWDKMGRIEYVSASRSEVEAKFRLTEDRIQEIVEKAKGGEPHFAEFSVEVTDTTDRRVVAKVDKVIYVRKKKGL